MLVSEYTVKDKEVDEYAILCCNRSC